MTSVSLALVAAVWVVQMCNGQMVTSPLKNDMPNKRWYTSYRAAWNLRDKPDRKMALLIDDTQEEYRDFFAKESVDNIVSLLAAFRKAGMPVVWSYWARRWQDGKTGSMDRFYGDAGTDSQLNPNYIWMDNGFEIMHEVAPTKEEEHMIVPSEHLDMFSNMDKDGYSIIHGMLQKLGVDTIVTVGAWTDECILATALSGFQKEYDSIVPWDAVGTPSPYGDEAMKIMTSICCRTDVSADIVAYLEERSAAQPKANTQIELAER
ncbi:unnamed protein product [Vitrella brassicaformis CCMP3155]|uniref:Isochorismatase-like domain-containing protein n=1 Tax=Vitrella brassicaformis (strain CCMP3155) TaxID=1169540 RepID=A0A0G4H475_VITBC|nr:unnamed protein product [Vitrella brassicaformis CCMP3155]|eukprot:CEM38409.1 unnamed protein product [Vitrella brassicaformis CCMP3155]